MKVIVKTAPQPEPPKTYDIIGLTQREAEVLVRLTGSTYCDAGSPADILYFELRRAGVNDTGGID